MRQQLHRLQRETAAIEAITAAANEQKRNDAFDNDATFEPISCADTLLVVEAISGSDWFEQDCTWDIRYQCGHTRTIHACPSTLDKFYWPAMHKLCPKCQGRETCPAKQ